MCSCFSNHVDEGLIPNAEYAPRVSQAPPPQLHSKLPKRHSTTVKQMTESHTPSSQRNSLSPSSPSNSPSAPPITGRRSRGASATHGSLPNVTASDKHRRSHDPTGNMLYFGTGLSPEQAMKSYKSPEPASSSSSSATAGGRHTAVASGGGGGGGGNASGRDASGYLSSSVSSANAMNGTYSSLTYGGSLQYNFAGTQSYGAGTAGGGGNGML